MFGVLELLLQPFPLPSVFNISITTDPTSPNKKMDGKASTLNQDELEEMRKVFAIFGF
jgi:hypothetical protein